MTGKNATPNGVNESLIELVNRAIVTATAARSELDAALMSDLMPWQCELLIHARRCVDEADDLIWKASSVGDLSESMVQSAYAREIVLGATGAYPSRSDSSKGVQ